jgi:hypothetical protein
MESKVKSEVSKMNAYTTTICLYELYMAAYFSKTRQALMVSDIITIENDMNILQFDVAAAKQSALIRKK